MTERQQEVEALLRGAPGRRMRLREVATRGAWKTTQDWNLREAYRILRDLEKKGRVRKIGRGLYELAEGGRDGDA